MIRADAEAVELVLSVIEVVTVMIALIVVVVLMVAVSIVDLVMVVVQWVVVYSDELLVSKTHFLLICSLICLN